MTAWVVRGRVIHHLDPAITTAVEYDALLDAVWCVRLLRFTFAVTGMVILAVVILLGTGR